MIVKDETEYEDLLSLWSDLEAGLGVLLANPSHVQEFEARVHQYDRWMQDLLVRDPDLGLYLLFQLATNSTVGYSTSHALVSAVMAAAATACSARAVRTASVIRAPPAATSPVASPAPTSS